MSRNNNIENEVYQRYLKERREKRIQHIKRLTSAAAALLAAAVLLLFGKNIIRAMYKPLALESVYTIAHRSGVSLFFPNCGNANCALIYSEEANVLIDCGHKKYDANILETLNMLEADSIDLAVLSDPKTRNIGNFAEVIKAYKPRRFVTCEYCTDYYSYDFGQLKYTLSDNDIPVEYVHTGDTFDYGKLHIEIVSPNKLYKKVSDNSVVIKMTYGEFTALFAGDVSEKAERDILDSGADINADLLCVSNHGSHTSSCEDFLAAVKPKYAIICCEGNDYYPSGETINHLAALGCDIYRTDISGMISVFSDGTDETKTIVPEIG